MKLDEQWAESFMIFFIALGFIISLLLKNAFFSYLSVILAGLVCGRIYYIKKYQEPILPFVLIIIGFLFGYIMGSIWVSRILVLFFFSLGFAVSYYLHMKNILVKFKSENFIK
ncbi:MAG: hypothetical protein ABH824_02535 [Nanoarchaeota archaeon]|nr:hypothetical protein [Nanoarchaeota archaeon]MBU1632650.1 hypothetical protein [Nanoarchaeota archaeon]MBU1876129.1 hypothetical protein [Nanoarchaeota archaeon]